MPIAKDFLAEFEMQAPCTRKFLERLPEDKLTWKPHDRSMTAGQLAYHLATIPAGIATFVENNPAQAPGKFEFPQPANRAEILKAHDEGVTMVRRQFAKFDDQALHEKFQLMAGDRLLMAVPRAGFIRDIMFSHWYQHRGQFAVYLRMLDVPVPSTWGPSADEAPAFMQHEVAVA